MTPVATEIQPPPNALDSYSKILGIQQGQQNLQIGAAALQSANAKASIDQRVARERQALAQIPWQNFQKEDGSFDEDGITKTAVAVAPTTGAEFAQHFNDMNRGSAETKAAWLGLDKEARSGIQSILGAWGADPNAKVGELASELQQYRDSAPAGSQKKLDTIIDHSMRVMGMVPDSAKPRIAMTLARAGLGQSELSGPGGLGTPIKGTAYDRSGNLVGTTQNQTTGGLSQAPGGMAAGPAPAVSIRTDANNQQFVVDQSGRVLGKLGGPAPGGTIGAAGFTQPVADQPAVMAELREARAATSQGGVTRNVNQHLLDLSDETKTGPGTQTLQGIAAALGMPSGSRYQEISAYLDRQAALQAQVMGVPNTNAGLAAAERATGTTEYTPQALREKVKFFDALNSGAMAYRQGLDKAVGTGATPDLSKYQAFRSAWTKNFDPDIYRAEDAQRRGDAKELAELKKRLGQRGMRELAVKSANLRLLEEGQIPQ